MQGLHKEEKYKNLTNGINSGVDKLITQQQQTMAAEDGILVQMRETMMAHATVSAGRTVKDDELHKIKELSSKLDLRTLVRY